MPKRSEKEPAVKKAESSSKNDRATAKRKTPADMPSRVITIRHTLGKVETLLPRDKKLKRSPLSSQQQGLRA